MTAVTLEEAHAKLPELLDQLQPGEELTITAADRSPALPGVYTDGYIESGETR